MSKKTKTLITVLAVVIALTMVLPMITAILPQKQNISSEDIRPFYSVYINKYF